MRKLVLLSFALAAVVIGSGFGTPRALEHMQTDIDAPMAETWSALIAQFAERGIPVAKLDEKKGVLISKTMSARNIRCASGGVCADTTYYSCGSTVGIAGRVDYPAQTVDYEARVRGDDAKSTVTVSAIYTSDIMDGRSHVHHDCDSQGRFESEIEQAVKLKAESAK
jgi:hypothetical protein